MALLPILKYPDPRLNQVAKPVEVVDDRIRQLVDDMLDTMSEADGVGLAATQVDVHVRLIVIDTTRREKPPLVLINPQIIARSDELVFDEEGCLSVPTIFDRVARHTQVTVSALDRDGKPFELQADGLLSVCIQHEMDHLNGKVFVEYLSPLKRDRIRTKLQKRAREAQRT